VHLAKILVRVTYQSHRVKGQNRTSKNITQAGRSSLSKRQYCATGKFATNVCMFAYRRMTVATLLCDNDVVVVYRLCLWRHVQLVQNGVLFH